jgi:hypothetical protein
MMGTPARILAVAEMQGRDLRRRHLAMILLVALPLAFYGALAEHATDAVIPGGLAAAFSMAGAAIFAVLAARPVDQRLVLAGYRPGELLAGRLLVLFVVSIPIVAGSSALMAAVSHPARPWVLGVAVAMVAMVAVPFGLAVAAMLPRELEATLVLIGVVGIQLSLSGSSFLSKVLPFYGARRLIDASLGASVSIWTGVGVTVAYAAGLFALSFVLSSRAVRVRRHPPPGPNA